MKIKTSNSLKSRLKSTNLWISNKHQINKKKAAISAMFCFANWFLFYPVVILNNFEFQFQLAFCRLPGSIPPIPYGKGTTDMK